MEPATAVETTSASEPVAKVDTAPQFTIPKISTTKAPAPSTGLRGSFADRITNTDIRRINGYLRFANIGGGIVLFLTGFIAMFLSGSYSEFVVAAFTM